MFFSQHILKEPQVLPCDHLICSTCIVPLFSQNVACPTCRTPFNADDIEPINGERSLEINDVVALFVELETAPTSHENVQEDEAPQPAMDVSLQTSSSSAGVVPPNPFGMNSSNTPPSNGIRNAVFSEEMSSEKFHELSSRVSAFGISKSDFSMASKRKCMLTQVHNWNESEIKFACGILQKLLVDVEMIRGFNLHNLPQHLSVCRDSMAMLLNEDRIFNKMYRSKSNNLTNANNNFPKHSKTPNFPKHPT